MLDVRDNQHAELCRVIANVKVNGMDTPIPPRNPEVPLHQEARLARARAIVGKQPDLVGYISDF
jgi:hypothetical protein